MSDTSSSPHLRRPEEGGTLPDLRVIGTAGHVDHGKSTLIAALTGVHPDRLKEEQEREMTIDLGFGWLTLPGGREVGIIDVPGHQDFIENMLAGVGGIDLVWLVVAADEGVMPQTREHLAIIDLLGIRSGLLVLTKTDLAGDPDWLDTIESDLRSNVRGTSLEDAPVVRVSARTGSGLPELLASTAKLLDQLPPRPNLSLPRLPLDRSFSMDGFGTVVTGTLTGGSLAVGEEVELLPSGLRGRVRGIQTHRRNVDRASPGSRTAVNVAGISAERLRRGEVLVHPGQYTSTRLVDARIRLLSQTATNLTHNRIAKLFLAASQTMCRVRVLGVDQLHPGEEGWIQLELQDAVVCARGDPFILRTPSPPETIGGGTIIEPHPPSRHRRHDESVLRALQAFSAGSPEEIAYEAVLAWGPAPVEEIARRSGLPGELAATAISDLVAASKVVVIKAGHVNGEADAWVLAPQDLKRIAERMTISLASFHGKYPLRRGMPREELRDQTGLDARAFQAMLTHLEHAGHLVSSGGLAMLSGHESRLTTSEQAAVDSLLQKFAANPYAPPSIKECIEAVGTDVWAALQDRATLVQVSAEVAFGRAIYDDMVQKIETEIGRRGRITLADVRDLFGTSRRYAQALLEHLDSIGITRRIGDARVMNPRMLHPPS